MKFKTLFPIYLFCFIISLPVSAKKWRVNNTLLAPTQVDFQELKAAIESDSVVSGDTIYVEASGISYEGEIVVDKQLTIIGPGYLLGQDHIQPSVCGSQNTATIGGEPGLSLLGESDGTFITGLTFATSFFSPISIVIGNTSNITITRNRLERLEFELGTSDEYKNSMNINIIRNLIEKDIDFRRYVNITNLLIHNNLVGGNIYSSYYNTSPTTLSISGIIQYNSLHSGGFDIIWSKGCEISYNLVGTIEANPADNGAIKNNRLGYNGSTNTNIVAWNSTNFIEYYDSNNWTFDTDDWTLGNDSTHGAHNGFDPILTNHPISPANIPAWPTIYECPLVQSCGDTTIQVQFKIRTNF